ncbi:MAG: DUF2269 family protein [Chitinophagaceae bacterium]
MNLSFYLLLKCIHLLAVVAFLGNISTGLFWMRYAFQLKDTNYMHHTVSGVILSDKYFTIPGVIIITIGGFGAAISGGLSLLGTGWIFWPIILFSLSGLIFVFKVGPLQTKMKRNLDKAITDENQDQNSFRVLFKQWEFWGLLALMMPIVSFFMMISKWPILSPLSK